MKFVHELTGMQCDTLLLVGHPDDDAIFAGELQRRLGMLDWTVVCVTHTADSSRGRELLAWQATLGTDPRRVHFLGGVDDPDDRRQGRCSLDAARLDAALIALSLAPRFVVTHGAAGEYGHPHHRFTHAMAERVYPATPRLFFAAANEPAEVTLTCPGKAERVVACYPSQATNVRRLVGTEERFVWGDSGGG